MRRKGQSITGNANNCQAKVAKFIKDAKEELDPENYETLIRALAKYHTGTNWVYILESSKEYEEVFEQLERALQGSKKLIQAINLMFPENHKVGKVFVLFYIRLSTLKLLTLLTKSK